MVAGFGTALFGVQATMATMGGGALLVVALLVTRLSPTAREIGRAMSSADLSLADLQTPWCIHVAPLRAADFIAAGVSDVDNLAKVTKSDSAALHSVLTHLVSKGVFEETAPGEFALNDTARGLLEPGTRLGLDLDGIGGRMAYAWGSLMTYVRTGSPGYADVFGRPFWEDLDANPKSGRASTS